MSDLQLECGCNNYPWGKKGKESLAAKYAAATPRGKFKLDESKEYAEVSNIRQDRSQILTSSAMDGN